MSHCSPQTSQKKSKKTLQAGFHDDSRASLQPSPRESRGSASACRTNSWTQFRIFYRSVSTDAGGLKHTCEWAGVTGVHSSCRYSRLSPEQQQSGWINHRGVSGHSGAKNRTAETRGRPARSSPWTIEKHLKYLCCSAAGPTHQQGPKVFTAAPTNDSEHRKMSYLTVCLLNSVLTTWFLQSRWKCFHIYSLIYCS